MRNTSAAPAVRIASVLPDPDGTDVCRETVTFAAASAIPLEGWAVRDKHDRTLPLSGEVSVGDELTFKAKKDEIRLPNDGGTVSLVNPAGDVVHSVTYKKAQVTEGATITFPDPNAAGKPTVAIQISALLPDPKGKDRGNETVTIKALAIPDVDFAGWTLTNASGTVHELRGVLGGSANLTVPLIRSRAMLNNKGDTLKLADPAGAVVHAVSYGRKDVQPGVLVDFPASDADDAADAPIPGNPRLPTVMIASLLPDPVGVDRGNEKVTVKARGGAANLTGWRLRDRTGSETELKGSVAENSEQTITIPKGKACLHNDGDEISLVDPSGAVAHRVTYALEDVKEGIFIDFGMYDFSPSGAYLRIPHVAIVAVLPHPDGEDRGRETVTLANTGRREIDVTGWTISDRNGKKVKLDGVISSGSERAFLTAPVWMHNNGDLLTLTTSEGVTADKVGYQKKDVGAGVMIDFDTSFKQNRLGTPRLPTVQICSMMPDPDGDDAGFEFVVLKSRGGETNLDGWHLIDSSGTKFPLTGDIQDGQDLSVFLNERAFNLSQKGDTIRLVDADGKIVSVMSYAQSEVQSGVLIDYGTTKENALVGKARLPTVMVARLVPNAGEHGVAESVTIKSRGVPANLSGWKIKNKLGEVYKLSGTVDDEKTFKTAPSMSLSANGDLVSLIDNEEREVHRVFYARADVVPGKALAF